MNQRCEKVRESLLVLPVTEFDDLSAHLDRCPSCAEAAERIRQAEAEIGRSLDDFAHAGDFEDAFARAASHRPPTARTWSPTAILTVAAAVLVTALALAPGLFDPEDPPEPDPVVLSPTAAPAPVAPEPEPAEPAVKEVPAPPPPVAPRAAPRPPQRQEPAPPPPPAAPAPPADGGACGDLDDRSHVGELRSQSYRGQLTPEVVACLEAAYAAGGDGREAISRILLEQAWVTDKPHFEQLALRHSKDLGHDLTTLYRLVVWYGEQKPRRSAEISEWAPIALDMREQWLTDGKGYGHRVNMMLQNLTYARIELWQQAVATNRRNPSPEAAAEAEAARVALLWAAKEWLKSGKETGLVTRQLAQYCRSAGGTDEECAE